MFNSVREVIEQSAQKFGEKKFLYCDGKEISFEEINSISSKVASLFHELGVSKGDKVSLYLPNCLEFVYCWFGLAKLGAVLVPINNYFKSDETSYVINNSDSKIVVTDSNALEMVLSIREECPSIEYVISVHPSQHSGIISFHDFLETQTEFSSDVEINCHDDAAILYTSGTTGHPKGCVEPQSYYLVNPGLWAEALELTSEDRVLTPLPLFHMNPQILSIMGALILGASVIVLDRFHPKSWWNDVIKYKATQFHYLGVMPAILYSLPPREKDREHNIRVTLGAGISNEYHQLYEERFGLQAVEVFGMTEVGLTMVTPINGERKVGTGCMGKTLPGFHASVVDENNQELPNGTVGELVIKEDPRPEGSAMMKGYYKNSEATQKAWEGGWFHTGDMVKKDEDGFFYFVDRKKDIIRRSGENISSMEVEDCVKAHPKVMEAAAVPVPDHIREQEVRVCIVLKEGESAATVTEQEIINWCSERLAYFKVPRYVEYINEFPKTASQKIQKSILKENLPEQCFDNVIKAQISLKEKISSAAKK
jgi:carnitine-CoA ligase